jgi:flagellar biosynthesis/type III secretory pathway M-ring protein FliF/YscJ
MATNDNDIWIAVITGAGTLAGVLGFNKIMPAIIERFKETREDKRKKQSATKGEYEELRTKIEELEIKLDKSERFEIQTRSTLKAMLPLMRVMMKDHPEFVALLKQLEDNILSNQS